MPIGLSEWAAICGVSRDTIASYVDILVDTWLVHVVPPFVGGKRAELTGRPKIYFCDTGLQNAILRRPMPFDEREDRGPLLESWVAGELRKQLSPLEPQDTLRFWRSTSGAEVDFVIERDAGLIAFEVKASMLKQPKLTRSARSFIEAYRPARLVVVNLSLDADETIDGTTVSWRTPKVMAQVGSLLNG